MTSLQLVAGGGLLLLERARELLQKASTVDEAKEIRDQVAALSVYVRARGAAEEDVRLAHIARLWAERRIGELTKAMPKATKAEAQAIRETKAGRARDSASPAPPTKQAALAEKGIDKKQAQRWEKLASIPAKDFTRFAEQRVDSAQRAAGKSEDKGPTHVSRNTGEVEWYTPAVYIEAARKIMGGIDLDPASCETANKTVKATKYYSKNNDGLSKKWAGRVWLNPPYAAGVVDDFVDKLEDEAKNIEAAIVLVNNATDTRWFLSLSVLSSAVCFLSGRVRFINKHGDPVGAPLQGQAVVYIGKNPAKFMEVMSELGHCWRK